MQRRRCRLIRENWQGYKQVFASWHFDRQIRRRRISIRQALSAVEKPGGQARADPGKTRVWRRLRGGNRIHVVYVEKDRPKRLILVTAWRERRQ